MTSEVKSDNKETIFIYREQKFPLDQLLGHSFAKNAVSPHLASTIAFLREWINEKDYVLIKTSGSTGKPKQIKIAKSKMIESAKATIATLTLPGGCSALLNLNTAFIGGKMMIVRALLNHMKLFIGELSASPFSAVRLKEKIDFYAFVPYQLHKILIENPERIKQLNQAKCIILGGAPVSLNLQKLIQDDLKVEVFSTYGMTETVSHVALKQLNSASDDEFFKALKGISFSADNSDRLIIHAPHIAIENPLFTNDVVRLINNTSFKWLGRHDFVINSGGIKIYPEALEAEISNLLLRQNTFFNFIIFPLADEKLGEKVCLLIEDEKAKERVDWKQLFLSLPKYERPKEVHHLKAFLMTESGKINRVKTIELLKEKRNLS